MRRYQAVLILDPDLEEKPLAEFQESFQKLLKKVQGRNIEVLEDNIRDLAHAISKRPRARFWRVGFEAPPSAIDSLRAGIRHDERVLRQTYLTASDIEAREEERPQEE